MNWEVFITCAVTGAGDTVGRHPAIPVTPKEIAEAAIEAAQAGAAIVHCHVRDPATGKGARDVALYREVVERIRSAEVDAVINLTAGMGGDLAFGPGEEPMAVDEAGTDMVGPLTKLAHVEELLPEICTLDCGSMNFGDGNAIVVNTPEMLRAGARRIRELGVKPECEVFDTGHLWFVNQLVKEELLADPPLIQLCHGIPTAPRPISSPRRRWSSSSRRSDLERVCDRPHADAVRCGGGPPRRQRARRPRGQPLPREGRIRVQPSARRARQEDR